MISVFWSSISGNWSFMWQLQMSPEGRIVQMACATIWPIQVRIPEQSHDFGPRSVVHLVLLMRLFWKCRRFHMIYFNDHWIRKLRMKFHVILQYHSIDTIHTWTWIIWSITVSVQVHTGFSPLRPFALLHGPYSMFGSMGRALAYPFRCFYRIGKGREG